MRQRAVFSSLSMVRDHLPRAKGIVQGLKAVKGMVIAEDKEA